MGSTDIWEERTWEKVKILKSNIDIGTVSSHHNVSSLDNSGSICVVIVLCRNSDVKSGLVSITHKISYCGSMVSTDVWEEGILEILESNLDAVSISHCFESIFEVNVLVGSVVLWCNTDDVSWSIGFKFITKFDILLLSWNNIHHGSKNHSLHFI